MTSSNSTSSMGNLEKLGILVIVILVVVVGVVAITPKSTGDERLYPDGDKQPLEVATVEPLDDPVTPPSANQPGHDDKWPGGQGAGQAVVAPPVAPPAPAPEPALRTVKIKKGDTLATIAKRELGSPTLYQLILDANPGIDPRRLKVDSEVKIPSRSPTPAKTETLSGPPGIPVAPSETSVWVVKSGDTLSSIAKAKLGSANKWGEILKFNEDVLHGSTNLKVGMKLRIPGATSSAAVPAASGAMASRDPVPATGLPAGVRTYVTRAGDTLALVAKSEMGSENFAKDLRAANQDVLLGSDVLQAGMTLKIPAVR